MNGSTEVTQEINAEYDKLFKILKDKHDNKAANTNKTTFNHMEFDFTEDEKLREILQKIINFDGIIIDLVGTWIWLDGNTYPYKNKLKEVGFRWSGQRKKWYWHSEEYRKRGNKNLSYTDIQNLYGSTEVQTESRKQLNQA